MRDCGRAKPAAIWAMRIENPFITRYADIAGDSRSGKANRILNDMISYSEFALYYHSRSGVYAPLFLSLFGLYVYYSTLTSK